jgi:hypothetical protein
MNGPVAPSLRSCRDLEDIAAAEVRSLAPTMMARRPDGKGIGSGLRAFEILGWRCFI